MTSRERNRYKIELRGREKTRLPSVLQHPMLSYITWADKAKTITCPTSSKHALDQAPDHNVGKQLRHIIRTAEGNRLRGQILKKMLNAVVMHVRTKLSFRSRCLHTTFQNPQLGSPQRWTVESPFYLTAQWL